MTTVLAWSGGKDATLALHRLIETGDPPLELYTTGIRETDRTSMHGVRWRLIRAQEDALGFDLQRIDIPTDAGNDAYEATMREHFQDYAERGVTEVAYADLYLEDIRQYRERLLANTPLTGRWPLWNELTQDIAREFIDLGYQATVVCVTDHLGPDYLGRTYDRDFLADLPSDADPCGENGEFHTFVHDGPHFDHPIQFDHGDTVTRTLDDTTHHYLDLT
ncbi:ATP-binding protein [Salarchaeum japonicum]|uniref:Dph6-related ATP pyrophosphatase n=1 Tax=Salarchaeum japonicum TaxID=555573 RepID=UPI003C7873BE